MSILPTRRAILLGVPALFLAAGVATAGWFGRPAPTDLDLSLVKVTAAGLYLAELAPEAEPVTVDPMHAWTVTLRTVDGAPVEQAGFAIDGGMPRHGHGLPTAPAVTQALGGGRFLVEGMKFNMPGWWELDLSIDGPAGTDTVTFNLVL